MKPDFATLMPFCLFNTDVIAQYLNLTGAGIDRPVKNGGIPPS
ncbi:MAG: hypothetical protein PHE83_04790 [Opitutaceae bacterium]|nr:hypothetical protein [Opitutaceae bacterium]